MEGPPTRSGRARGPTSGRHTAATLLLTEGVHPRVVMEVLGHAQMRTTTDTYSHVMPALGATRQTKWQTRCGTDLAPQSRQWPPRWYRERLRPLFPRENGRIIGVELRGLEPLTPTLPGRHDRVHGGSLPSHEHTDLQFRPPTHLGARSGTPSTATRTATTREGVRHPAGRECRVWPSRRRYVPLHRRGSCWPLGLRANPAAPSTMGGVRATSAE